jgi:anti-sigma regulatory factor (Ser/Thr protein kinase)
MRMRINGEKREVVASPGKIGSMQVPMQEGALRVTAVFEAATDQVRHARHFAEAMLRGWPVADDVALIVSEFSANAVLHSASGGQGKFWVHLEAYPGEYAWVEVRDEGGSWVRREHRDGRPHGLDIVGELAAECGVDGDARTGWIAWARLELAAPDVDVVEPEMTTQNRQARIGVESAAGKAPAKGG